MERPVGQAVGRNPKKTPVRKESYTIAFRVDADLLTYLTEKAAPYGVSVHEYARQKLMEVAGAKDTEALREEVGQVKQGLTQLREDIAVTLEVLLANLTSSDPQRIRAWVDENLRGT